MPKNRTIPSALILVVGMVAVSTASLFIRLAQAELNSLAVAAWRLTLASLMLAPFALTGRRAELRALSRCDWLLMFASGAMLAVHFAAWIHSLALTSVAASVVLVTTSPLFVGVISHFAFGERLTRAMVGGLVIALLGSFIIALGDLGVGTHQLLGDLLALIGAFAAGGYLLIGRQLRARLSLLGYVFPVYATAALLLIAATFISGVSLQVPNPRIWLWVILMALLPQAVGHTALNWALHDLSATYVSLATLAEPIGSALLVWWLLAEAPTPIAVMGGALILTGIALATRSGGGHGRRVMGKG